ncbi:ATP-binding protein [Hymenobacter metallilatus]|uniref:histidine kinase n=1 Tax=Hymenobacter metallilatus TaxID=2493666 RepID=A0A3R9UKI6_9BACT|nr:tetratricopeptide repeat protein [Hymenobacter metallilatus]RSK33850.1 tetratricopeptide repeat protein [Hymenobacter metallilatus]
MQHVVRAVLKGWGGVVVLVSCCWSAAGAGNPGGVPTIRELSVPEARTLLATALAALPAATRQQDTLRLRQLYWSAGQAYYTLGRPELALQQYRHARRFSQPDSEATAWTHWLAGRALLSQGDTGKARQTYQLALHTFRQRRQLNGQGQVWEHLGELYGRTGHWFRAQKSYEQALAAWQLAHNHAHTAQVLHRLGGAHLEQQHPSRALYYLQQSIAWARRQQDSAQTSAAYNGMGQVYQSLSNTETANSWFQQALQWLPTTAPARQRTVVLRDLGISYDSLGNEAAASRYLQAALVPARHSGSPVLLSELYAALTSLYRRHRKPQAALDALTRFTALQDSVAAEQRLAQVAELQTRYETEKKEREIQLLIKERQLQQANLRWQKMVRNLLAVSVVLLLATALGLYRAQRRQRHTNRLLHWKNAAINRQKEELDRLNQTKDTLFSIISHDLRGPLSSLYSLLALLKLGRLPADRLAAHSERLTRMLDGTLHLLDNLLNWSASQLKGEGSARPERIRLDELVEEAVALFQGDADRKEIQLLNKVPEVCLARADINMIRLVLRNLLSNALKFTAAGGTVTVAARRQAQWWMVTVQDTGVGMEADQQARLLGHQGPFSTLGTAREKGTGLGLQLCQEFVQRNGGEFSFQSQEGVGSQFHFTLPALDEDSPVVLAGRRQSAVTAAAE